jgi:hypothetical protein
MVEDMTENNARLELAKRFEARAAKFRPDVFGADDRQHGPMLTKDENLLVAAALRSSAEPVAWITKAALANWLKGHDPERHVLLRSGHHSDLRVALYLSAPPVSAPGIVHAAGGDGTFDESDDVSPETTPIMQAAASAAETVAGWSDAKREHAARVMGDASPEPTLRSSGEDAEPYGCVYQTEDYRGIYTHMHAGKPAAGAKNVRWLYIGDPQSDRTAPQAPEPTREEINPEQILDALRASIFLHKSGGLSVEIGGFGEAVQAILALTKPRSEARAPTHCPNGLEHGTCLHPDCVSSCPGRLPMRSEARDEQGEGM